MASRLLRSPWSLREGTGHQRFCVRAQSARSSQTQSDSPAKKALLHEVPMHDCQPPNTSASAQLKTDSFRDFGPLEGGL